VSPIRSIVAELKASLEAGGIESMAETHAAAVRSSSTYRWFCRFVDLVYPISALLDLFEGVDRQIGELGVTEASRAFLAVLPTSWSATFPANTESEIRSKPVVVFGKHGSILTPFLVAAALDRPDMKMLGATYVAHLGPNVAALTYTVHLPTPTLRRAARRGILLRLGAWLTVRLSRSVNHDAAREHNRASLAAAVSHIRGGGALLVAPDARNPRAKWQSGIGVLVAHLAQDIDSAHEAYLVPYRIWASITGIFHILSRNPLLRALGRWEYRRPIRIAFAEPIPVSVIIAQVGTDPGAITECLEAHYRAIGF